MIPARDPKQCGGSKRILYYNVVVGNDGVNIDDDDDVGDGGDADDDGDLDDDGDEDHGDMTMMRRRRRMIMRKMKWRMKRWRMIM